MHSLSDLQLRIFTDSEEGVSRVKEMDERLKARVGKKKGENEVVKIESYFLSCYFIRTTDVGSLIVGLDTTGKKSKNVY
jgi:hypothetical protein